MAKKSERKQNDICTVILFLLLLVAGFCLLGFGILLADESNDYTVMALGVLAVIIPASICSVVMQRCGGWTPKQTELLESINERLLLSDNSRQYLDMENDRAILRVAIMADIENGRYDEAMALVAEMSEKYGLREESEKYREEIDNARALQLESEIETAISEISTICMEHDWEGAMRKVNRLLRLFPDHIRVAALPQHVEQSRDNHKRELEREFLNAAEAGEVDRATELMKELDRYLTPEEAEPYVETARGVIGRKRENLGVQFKLAVHDRDWISAMRLGETIIREFPNTKMANEVRDMLDLLRQRAAGQRAAEGSD